MTALSLPTHALARRVAAAVLVLAYAMPIWLGMTSDLGHGTAHVWERLQERRAAAAALGLAHLGEQSSFTHTHGGETHSHVGTVGALLSAADQTDEEQDAAAPLVKVLAHAPATVAEVWVGLVVARTTPAPDAIASAHPRALPPVPPPRA